MKIYSKRCNGMTLIEVLITVVIVSLLSGIFMATMAGVRSRDVIDRTAQQIYDDVILIRSKAISTNQNYRLSFTANNQWKVQAQNATTLAWSDASGVRYMPSNTNLTSTSYTNAASNLEASPRGMFTLQNSASGSPYVTVTALGASKTKSINVFVGGAIELRVP